MLSLCMIARNEERFLAGCLESVRGVADEMIVVDTGSRDDTVPIALRAGARVVAFDWIDDFSAARNAGLDVARGTHVLVLDADERLAPGTGPVIRAAMKDPDLLLGSLPLYNASTLDAKPQEILDGTRRIGGSVWVPRLFPRRPEMRYERRVHESLANGFNLLHAQGQGDSKAVRAPILHFGDVPSLRKRLGKDERNDRLLREQLDEDPADGEMAGYLVVELLKRGECQEARQVGERSFDLFMQAIDNRPEGHLPLNTARIGYALSFAQVETGDPAAALDTAQRAAERMIYEHPNLTYAEGFALEKLGRGDEAIARYRRCLELHGVELAQPVLPGLTSDLARLRIAEIAFLAGRLEEARNEVRQVGGAWTIKGRFLAAEIELAAGRPKGALELLSPLVELKGLPPDYYALTHRALTQLGRDASELLAIIESTPIERRLEPRRFA